jgi:putative PIN family toxin of toxin-antitoxin system
MKVFLDTNVVASALATRGLCSDVLREVLESHDMVISRLLLKELERVLMCKFRMPKVLVGEVLSWLSADAEMAPKGRVSDLPPVKDRAGREMLAGALGAGCDAFVTGDKELLDLKHARGMPIVSPRGFWETVRSS